MLFWQPWHTVIPESMLFSHKLSVIVWYYFRAYPWVYLDDLLACMIVICLFIGTWIIICVAQCQPVYGGNVPCYPSCPWAVTPVSVNGYTLLLCMLWPWINMLKNKLLFKPIPLFPSFFPWENCGRRPGMWLSNKIKCQVGRIGKTLGLRGPHKMVRLEKTHIVAS